MSEQNNLNEGAPSGASTEDAAVTQTPFGDQELSPQQAKEKAGVTRSRIIEVLNRGFVSDRFIQAASHLGSDRVAIWARDRQEDIAKYQALGGRIERRADNPEGGLHDKADDKIRIGDLILMSIERSTWEEVKEYLKDLTFRKLGAGRREALQGIPREQVVGDVEGHANIVRGRRE